MVRVMDLGRGEEWECRIRFVLDHHGIPFVRLEHARLCRLLLKCHCLSGCQGVVFPPSPRETGRAA